MERMFHVESLQMAYTVHKFTFESEIDTRVIHADEHNELYTKTWKYDHRHQNHSNNVQLKMHNEITVAN